MTSIHLPPGAGRIIPIEISAGVGGRYRARKGKNLGYTDVNSGLWMPGRDVVLEELDWWNNIITDTGLDHIGNNGTYLDYCHVGTGTSTETATDTQLQTFVAGKAKLGDVSRSFGAAQGSAPYYGRGVRGYRFNPGEATGNISEVGISTQITTGNLFSRARVKDGGGSPTTIEVLPDEYLDVDYEFRVYPAYDTADLDTTVSGEAFVLRAAKVTTNDNMGRALSPTFIQAAGRFAAVGSDWGKVYSNNAALGAVTAEPTAAENDNVAYTNSTNDSYGNGNSYVDVTYTVPLNDGNFTGDQLKGLMFYTTMGSYQIVFDSAQAKDETQEAELEVRLGWARATIP